MRHRNSKHLFLVIIGILMVGLISLTGCGGGDTTTGTGGGGGSSNTPSNTSSSAIEVTSQQLVAAPNDYIGKYVFLTEVTVDSVTGSYIMIGSIKCEPQDLSSLGPASILSVLSLDAISTGDIVDVRGVVQGVSGGVVTLTNGHILSP